MDEFSAEDRKRVGAWLRKVRRLGGAEWRNVETFASRIGRSSRAIRGMERGERVGLDTYELAAKELGVSFHLVSAGLAGADMPESVQVQPIRVLELMDQMWEPVSGRGSVSHGRDEAGDYIKGVSTQRAGGVVSGVELRFWPGKASLDVPASLMSEIVGGVHRELIASTTDNQEGGNDAGTAEAQKSPNEVEVSPETIDLDVTSDATRQQPGSD